MSKQLLSPFSNLWSPCLELPRFFLVVVVIVVDDDEEEDCISNDEDDNDDDEEEEDEDEDEDDDGGVVPVLRKNRMHSSKTQKTSQRLAVEWHTDSKLRQGFSSLLTVCSAIAVCVVV